ncbi:MAG TPA: carboxylesterase family protein [Actinospica sp.]|nr:carboxylesterase family protein [Actinospica sp.]
MDLHGPAASQATEAASTKVRPQSLLVATDTGQLEGRTTGPVDQFLGIPYAQPPVGALRWAPPTPMAAWTGVRSALAYGNRCAQPANGNGPRADDEDCLYLNVFSPAYVPASGLPVLFMIHGGGLTTGAGDQQDGSQLAETQHVVVVSINYRLGPLGFLDVPGLEGSGTATDGNFGLLDQEAALRWTAANIGQFGGDPSKVTVAGESAGGWSVCALLSAPGARGLFARAVMESGSCASRTAASAQTAGLAFAAKVGCTQAASAAACLRTKSETELLDASSGYQPEFIAGGADLPVAPAMAVSTGQYTKVPILFGDNHDEGRTFTQGFAYDTEAQYVAFLDSTYGTLAPQVLARYPWSAYPSPYTAAYAVGAIFTDSGAVTGIGGCTAQTLADEFAASTRTYFFQFDDRNAPGLNNSVPDYQWGAGHAMELAYLWPSFTNGFSLYAEFTPAQLELSREMLDSWGAFVRTGSPDTAQWPAWPALSSHGAQRLMSLRPGGQSRLISGAEYGAEHQCGFWNGVSS